MNLAFFDIDGTLAHGKNVPQSAQDAIAQFRNNGNLTFICTGRSLSYVKKNFSAYADGFVTSNGRYAETDEGKVLYRRPLSKERIQDVCGKLDSVHAGYTFFSNEAGYYGGNESGYADACMGWDAGFIRKGLDEKAEIFNFDVWYEDDAMKQKVQDVLAGYIINPHGPFHTADVTIPGADKGTALKAVAAGLRVDLSHTWAFGDGMNDLCMLEAAGHGIAMGNAVDALKEKAEYVTTDIDQNGIRNGLRQYHLI